jgi:MoaA/NifB/PqqE/SkfB family radical SAM enzyme
MLTREKAEYLAKVGIDKVGISIDSGFEYEHDRFRGKRGSYRRAIEALKNAKTAGLRTMISAVVTHQNIRSEGFQRLLDLSAEFDVNLDLQCGTVSGGWRGNVDVLIDEKDAEYLESLRAKYPLLRRDVWSVPGSIGGCPAGTRSIYIIPSGDVLPCLFIHVSFGNVSEEPLSVIQKRMLKVKEFREFSTLCFAGEDRGFINNYLSKTFNSKRLPLDYRDVFGDL